MKKIISFNTAAKIIILIYSIFLLFHITIIIGAGILNVIPIDIVWGGRLENSKQLIHYETIAFLVIGLCLFLTLIKIRYIYISKLFNISHYAMWIFFFYFALNTVGNCLANTILEKSFALLSITLSLLSLRLALEK